MNKTDFCEEALLLPSLKKAKDMANRIKCAGNLKQFGCAINFYTGDYNDWVPAMYLGNVGGPTWWMYTLGPPYELGLNSFLCPSGRSTDTAWLRDNSDTAVQAPLSYAYNRRFGHSNVDGDTEMVRISRIPKSCSDIHIMTDDKVSHYYYEGAGNLSTYLHRVGDRHNGLANFLYLDAHVEPHNRVKDLDLLVSQGDPH